jgi:amino acid permease
MTKANVGLGILQIPFVFMDIGLIPGIILLIGMMILIACEWKGESGE